MVIPEREEVMEFEYPESLAALYRCAWCNESMCDNTELLGIGAKIRSRIDISTRAGETLTLPITVEDGSLKAYVYRSNESMNPEHNILFMVCSGACGRKLLGCLGEEPRAREMLEAVEAYWPDA